MVAQKSSNLTLAVGDRKRVTQASFGVDTERVIAELEDRDAYRSLACIGGQTLANLVCHHLKYTAPRAINDETTANQGIDFHHLRTRGLIRADDRIFLQSSSPTSAKISSAAGLGVACLLIPLFLHFWVRILFSDFSSFLYYLLLSVLLGDLGPCSVRTI